MSRPDIDTVLFDLLCECPDPPDYAEMLVWCERFPEHRRDIVDFCVSWLLVETLPAGYFAR